MPWLTAILCCRETNTGSGFYSALANDTGALQVWPEHRYYATQAPFLPGDNFGHSTIEQALVDHVELVLYIQNLYNLSTSPVIAIGSSYSKQPTMNLLTSSQHCASVQSTLSMTVNHAINVQLHISFAVAAAVPALQHSRSEGHAKVGVVPVPKLHHLFADDLLRAKFNSCNLTSTLPDAGANLASYLRIRYPDVIAGAICSSSVSFSAYGLVCCSPDCTLFCIGTVLLRVGIVTACLHSSMQCCLHAVPSDIVDLMCSALDHDVMSNCHVCRTPAMTHMPVPR